MGVKIYKRMREWWRAPNEVVPGADPSPAELRRKFLEKKRVREEDEDESPVLGDEDDINEDDLVPQDVENPEDIVDEVEGENDADEIADQITVNIEGIEYNLVPVSGNDEQPDLGIDAQAEMDDISQPDEMSNDIGDEEANELNNDEDELKNESLSRKALLKRKVSEALAKRKIAQIREKILSKRAALREEDEEFFNGEDESFDNSETNVNAVMEARARRARALKELRGLNDRRKQILEDLGGELDLPMAKDSNSSFAKKGGPKSAYTPANSGEDYKKKIGDDKRFAARGPGRDIKSAYTPSAGAKPKDFDGNDGFNGRGPGEQPRKAYTPSKSGDAGPTKKRVESRVLDRRMRRVAEVEGTEYSDGEVEISGKGQKPVVDQIGKDVRTGSEIVDTQADREEQALDTAKNTEIFEKLQKIRANRLARRNESVEDKGIVYPNEEIKTSLEGTLKESFDFKKLMEGKYE